MAVLAKRTLGPIWQLVVDSDPTGADTAPIGSEAFLITTGTLLINTDGGTTWEVVGAGGGAGFLADDELLALSTTNISLALSTEALDPTAPQEATALAREASDYYVAKTTALLATTANITLSGLQTIDDVLTVADDVVLVKNQSTGAQNGLYLAKVGAWVRLTDFDSNSGSSIDVRKGAFCYVTSGTVNTGTEWYLSTANPITIGTTALTFTQLTPKNDFALSQTPLVAANVRMWLNGAEQTYTTHFTVSGTVATWLGADFSATDEVIFNYAY